MTSLPILSFDSIGFFGSTMGIGTISGYGQVAVNLIKAWQIYNGIRVDWGNMEAPVGFSFSQPAFYQYENSKQLNIGYTPWESTRLPDAWKFYMDKMDAIWTTSNACKEWFENAGIDNEIKVLHHGINRKHYPARMRTFNPDQEPFTFLHIGSETKRKGGKLVLDAFEYLFGNDPRYHLILKGNPPWTTDLMNVSIIRKYLSQEEMTNLYDRAHAMVYPTSGEGFGLIPFQSASMGIPTAVTNWGGPRDYREYFWPLSVDHLVETDYEPHEGKWAVPSREVIKDFMIDVSSFYEDFRTIAYNNALAMDEYWSWKNIAHISLGYMQESLNNF